MSELAAIDRWLVAVLTGDSTLHGLVADRIFDGIAPQGTLAPYIICQTQAPHDVAGVGAVRIMVESVSIIKCLAEGTSYSTLHAIANRIDALLHKASGTNADGTVLGCVREMPFKMAETTEGKEYRWLGGVYRIWAQ